MSDPLLGSLEDFRDWCLGTTRLEGTVHYSTIAAIDRYQEFKRKQQNDAAGVLANQATATSCDE